MLRRLAVTGVLAAAGVLAAVILARGWRDRATAEVAGGAAASAVESPWTPEPGDWTCWRGPDGTNRTAARVPRHWTGTAGVRWKASVPGRGHASPILCGDRLFVATADEPSAAQTLLCYRASDGELLWRHATLRGGWMPLHPKNTHASSTPACDGRRVFVAGIAHGGLWVTAVGLDGERLWQQRVGPFTSQHGYAAALALHRGLVIVSGENRGSGVGQLAGVTSYLAALTRDGGAVAWRVRRPALPSYGSPVVGDSQLVISGAKGVSGYEPGTGRLVWEHPWDEGRTASTVAFGGGRFFASRTLPSAQVVAVGADGARWSQAGGAADVPAPLWDEGRLYLVSDQGVLTCLDDAAGEVRWKLRLGGTFSASPLLAAGHLYCTNEQGTTFVVGLEGKGKVVGRNPLGEAVYATPAPAAGRLYFRTEAGVVCVEGANALGRAE